MARYISLIISLISSALAIYGNYIYLLKKTWEFHFVPLTKLLFSIEPLGPEMNENSFLC